MQHSTERILTTHPGRLPNPANFAAVQQARSDGNQEKFDAEVKAGVAEMIRKQKEIGIDVMSDGEFWKGRDQKYYDSRASGFQIRPLREGEPPSVLVHQRERRMPEFREFWQIYDRVGNTPMPGVEIRGMGLQTMRTDVVEEVIPRPPDTIEHEIAVVKEAIAAARESVDNFFFPVISPSWLNHFVFNAHYQTEEEFVYGLATFFKADYKAVVDAGFVLQIDDPSLVDKWGMFDPEISIEDYRAHMQLRIEALNWALADLPEDRIRYHTCWGSWHTPHTTDLPLEHVVDIMLQVRAGAYSIETADVRHILDYKVWEKNKLPEGKVFIPGVIAHKTSTVEPPELVADMIVRYANIMGRENIIAGVDCGVGGRCYPDIGWAKLRSLVQGAELASKQLWG